LYITRLTKGMADKRSALLGLALLGDVLSFLVGAAALPLWLRGLEYPKTRTTRRPDDD
jgi:hypothetical protein